MSNDANNTTAGGPSKGAMRKIDLTARDWTKRYAPQTIDDFVLPQKLMKLLQDFRDVRDFPHLLFHGPPGVGKTSSAVALMKDTAREPHKHDCHLRGSVNDFRGIDSVWGLLHNGTVMSDRIGLIMEEACSLKMDAQMAQRGAFLEDTVCPAIYTCNDIAKIIEPLRNRLVPVDFAYAVQKADETRELALDRLCWILENEGIDCDRGLVADATAHDLPSMRQAIMRLQGIHTRLGPKTSAKAAEMTEPAVSDVAETNPETDIDWDQIRAAIGTFACRDAGTDREESADDGQPLPEDEASSPPGTALSIIAESSPSDENAVDTSGGLPVVYSPAIGGQVEDTELAKLLDETCQFVRRHLYLSKGDAELIVTWAFFTHVYRQFRHCPLLIVLSAAEGCGKTTLLEILECLTARGQLYVDISAAVMNRFPTSGYLTLLGDEVRPSDLPKIEKAALSGWSYSGKAPRIDGGRLVSFPTWYPKALARIGRFPREIESRGILITLTKAVLEDGVKPFDLAARTVATDLGQRIAELAATFDRSFLDANPDIPATFINRMADNFRPLLAIADAAGGRWPQDLRAAAQRIVDSTTSEELEQVQLLSDIRDIFDRLGIDRIPSEQLLDELLQLEGHQLAGWTGSRQSKMNRIARLMHLFNVRPRPISNLIRGYHREDMKKSFDRFLPKKPGDTAKAAA